MNMKLHQDSRVAWVVFGARLICVTATQRQSERTRASTQYHVRYRYWSPVHFSRLMGGRNTSSDPNWKNRNTKRTL